MSVYERSMLCWAQELDSMLKEAAGYVQVDGNAEEAGTSQSHDSVRVLGSRRNQKRSSSGTLWRWWRLSHLDDSWTLCNVHELLKYCRHSVQEELTSFWLRAPEKLERSLSSSLALK